MKPDVLVTDFYCDKCGKHPGAWLLSGKKLPLPVPEESEYLRGVTKWWTHNKCGGRAIISTEPLAHDD